MFKALDENHNMIHIEASLEGAKYYCPICKGSLVIKARRSESIITHFAHKSKKECDTFSFDMSDWHKEWQNRFPLKNQEVPLPFDEPCHRADVLAYGYVIEFQHSPISVEEFDERNRFYTSIGKKVVWLFDMHEKFDQGRFSVIEPTYEFDGYYTDYNGRSRKKWIVNEYRVATILGHSIETNGIEYEYGRNDKNTLQKTHEWKWLRPLNNLIHYDPMVNKDITVFLEFAPNRLVKIIWCDNVIDDSKACSISGALHEYGQEFIDPSVTNYLNNYDKIVLRSNFGRFTATEYTIRDFLLGIKNRYY